MYKAPDLIKVDINVTESFAAYDVCQMISGGAWQNVDPCKDKPDAVEMTYVSAGMGYQCFINNMG